MATVETFSISTNCGYEQGVLASLKLIDPNIDSLHMVALEQ
jgi:hypothetical protein